MLDLGWCSVSTSRSSGAPRLWQDCQHNLTGAVNLHDFHVIVAAFRSWPHRCPWLEKLKASLIGWHPPTNHRPLPRIMVISGTEFSAGVTGGKWTGLWGWSLGVGGELVPSAHRINPIPTHVSLCRDRVDVRSLPDAHTPDLLEGLATTHSCIRIEVHRRLITSTFKPWVPLFRGW